MDCKKTKNTPTAAVNDSNIPVDHLRDLLNQYHFFASFKYQLQYSWVWRADNYGY